MIDVDLDLHQLRALSAVAAQGTLDAAARALHVTPSAISQRLKALEVTAGRVLLVRSKPVQLTESGTVLLRVARQIEALAGDVDRQLGSRGAGVRPISLPIAVNADSMASWVLAALAPLAGTVCFDLHRDDESRTSALLRSGTVMGAITTQAEPVPGCTSTRLGSLRYRPTATPGFVQRWFPDGMTAAALAAAPVVVFDRKDDLQHQCLRRLTRTRLDPPLHYVPASTDFLEAVRLGFGWGMTFALQSGSLIADGQLVELDPRGAVDVTLYWQQWKLESAALELVADAILAGAATYLS